MLRKAFLVGLFIACEAASTLAATPLSMEEAQQRALEANPSLQAAKLGAVAARERAKEAFGRHFGELDLVGTYNHFERDRIVVPMAKELFVVPALGLGQLPWDRNQVHYGLVWQVPLLASGGLHEGDKIAKLSRAASEHLALFTRDQIVYNVRAAYRNALIASHALASVEAYRAALAKDEEDSALKVKVGAMAPVDAAKITYALRGAEAQAAELGAQSETAQAMLAALMGEEAPPGGYELKDVPGEPAAPAEPGARNKSAALSGRGDLLAQREGTAIFEHKKHLALEAFSPQLVLQGTYLKNDAPSLNDPLYTREWALMLKVPLFNGLSRVYAVQEADANLLAAKQREKAKALEIETQVIEAEGRLNSARALYKAGEAQRGLGREVARVERLKLDQGTGKMEDYLAARSQELMGETSYWRGLYAYQSAVDYMNFVTARGGEHE